MSSFLEYAKEFEIVKNEAVETFLAALNKQLEDFKKGTVTRRSWVKPDGSGFTLKLGKIAKEYYLRDAKEVVSFLEMAASAAREEAEFKAMVEAAYGGGSESEEAPKPRRGRKPKNA